MCSVCHVGFVCSVRILSVLCVFRCATLDGWESCVFGASRRLEVFSVSVRRGPGCFLWAMSALFAALLFLLGYVFGVSRWTVG